ncbi:Cu(I)-responsive transcriptional regulator [Caballeronia novacaledonica]|uniref:Cu(I)-responsive transcriptional regulator n=2 Tax=Caballeronia novacaledonica TaxID=1544861 RepID=A0ACB5QYH2_9BURK|nr:Cu(I)-responsive transcriptional regulator [Caballeronia novacaledonica]GJH20214.1 Cu(I)-responsive transcriptional regulator [Caballeronia novacaledonica]GJH28580.1 Cu(I)-responsive transcriptional regulator [Caballeronia novacaledonica]
MNIGEVAKSSGMSAKMIRHYEETGLIQAAPRTGSNYRVYTPRDVQVLRFVQQARHLGFSTRQIAVLLALWEDESRSSREVKQLANAHMADLNLRIQELIEMRDALMHLAAHCKGDSRPDCPILGKLAGEAH